MHEWAYLPDWASDLPKPASNPVSAASATPMTTASSSTKPTTTVKRAQPRRPDSRQQVSDRPGGLHRIAVDRLPMRPTHGHQTGVGSNGQTDHFQGIPNRSRSPRESRPLPPTTSLPISQTNRRTRSSQSSLRGQMTGLAISSPPPLPPPASPPPTSVPSSGCGRRLRSPAARPRRHRQVCRTP